MSVEVTTEVVPPGATDRAEDAWDLKERIRVQDDVLKQRRGFFMDAYRRSRVVLFLAGTEVVAFAAARRDGYILFLAVAPEHRGEGLGERLVAEVADHASSVTCHARVTNTDALAFYEAVGFERVRRIDGYYEDGGDAWYLRLGEKRKLLERLSEYLRR
ncbi:MAG: GNAT family N-acetyltransferase [Halobacteriaceae archaeon]